MAKAKKGNSIYGAWDNLNKLIKLVLQFFLGWIISVVYRIIKGLETKDMFLTVVGIIFIFGPCIVFWILDFIWTILDKKWLLT